MVFPVSYNEKFYKDVLEAGELAKLAYYNDIVVCYVCYKENIDYNRSGFKGLNNYIVRFRSAQFVVE